MAPLIAAAPLIGLIGAGVGAAGTVLGGIANIRRNHSDAVVSQYDISPMVQIYATIQGRDLGAVSADIPMMRPMSMRQPAMSASRTTPLGKYLMGVFATTSD